MDEHATVPARRLTGGRRKLLELAMALALRPRMILLDDLLAGLTPTVLGTGMIFHSAPLECVPAGDCGPLGRHLQSAAAA